MHATIVGSVVGSDPSFPGGRQAGCAAGAEPGVLEPYQQDGFFSSRTSFLTLIGSLGPWE